HAGNQGMHKYASVCPQIFLVGNELMGNRSDFGPGIHNLNTAIVLLDNVLDDDLSGEDSKEIYNTDINYSYTNDGIINAARNRVKRGFQSQGRIYRDFPIIHSHAHRWKVKNISSDKVKLSFVPPPWLQWWALSLYFLALVFIFWLYRKYLFYRFNLKAALELEKQEKERILQLDQVRSRFFANISHEFRTPITLIDAPLQDLLEDTRIKGRQRSNLNLIQENVRRLLNLIRQMLELGRLEAGAIRLQAERGDLNAFVGGLVASYESLADHRQISYVFHADEQPEEIYFDADKIEKILHNLLSNAFKFCDSGDRIDIYLRYHDVKDPEHCQVELEVADTGPGLSTDQKEHLFDRFYRADSKYKSDREGSGIGLSLVKELVDLYRGSIRVESTHGYGSRFIVSLPCGKAKLRKEEMERETGNKIQTETQEQIFPDPSDTEIISFEESKMDLRDFPCVLIVEDNDQLRSYMIRHLEDELCVLQAENGQTGLEIALEKQPALIISDLMMPEMDGGEMVVKLRNDERTCHIPII
ncbi:MAG: ATP-binding protein, partial [Bacteroidales bacterium]